MNRLLQVTSLPLHALLLAGGGNLTYCKLLSLAGLDPHHTYEQSATTAICLKSCDHDDEEKQSPCPGECTIDLPDAEVTVIKGFVFTVQPLLLPWSEGSQAKRTRHETEVIRTRSLAPPGNPDRLASSQHTGRFLL